jgi:hypothetical protein
MRDQMISFVLIAILQWDIIFKNLTVLLNSPRMVYSGCPGKTFKSTSGQYIYAVSTPLRCGILSMVNGEATVLVDAKIMLPGIKIHSSD